MKNKGFTLIEMIAVIGIIALMAIMVLPIIINQVAGKKEEISEATEKMIFSATELYMDDNSASYPKIVNTVYCIKLDKLISSGYLKSPLKDVKAGKDIDTSRVIKLSINSYSEYDNFSILAKGEETELCS